MHLEAIRDYCLRLPAATEDIKWETDLCFLVGQKMFCMADLRDPLTVSFKVPAELFEEIAARPGFRPAPYFGQHKWVMVTDLTALTWPELQHFIRQSYELVKARLPKRLRTTLF